MRSIGILIAGLITGWLLHGYLQTEPLKPEVVDIVSTSRPAGVAAAKQPIFNPDTDAGQNLPESATGVTEPAPQRPPRQNHVEGMRTALRSGSYDQAVSLCIRLVDQGRNECRSMLLEFSNSAAITRADARFLLELWLAEKPDDVDAGSILVDQAIEDERFVDAVERLALLKSYQTEATAIDMITQRAQHLARMAILRLTLQEDFVSLKSVLTSMVDMEPERAAWRFHLARVMQDLEQYNAAISVLTYILYDTAYGDRAARLYAEITRQVNLAGYVEVPLRRSGSQLLVDALVNGTYQITLLVDTGASLTAINREALQRIGINPVSDRIVTLDTAGGKIQSSLVKLNSFSIGGQSIGDVNVASISFRQNESDGLLGMNYLNNFRFIIDQKQRKLYLSLK